MCCVEYRVILQVAQVETVAETTITSPLIVNVVVVILSVIGMYVVVICIVILVHLRSYFARYCMSSYYQRKLSEKLSAFQDGEVGAFASLTCCAFQFIVCFPALFCSLTAALAGLKPFSPFFESSLYA